MNKITNNKQNLLQYSSEKTTDDNILFSSTNDVTQTTNNNTVEAVDLLSEEDSSTESDDNTLPNYQSEQLHKSMIDCGKSYLYNLTSNYVFDDTPPYKFIGYRKYDEDLQLYYVEYT